MGELVEDLERLGYVTRRPNPHDGRAKIVVLTEKGEAAMTCGIAAVTDLEARWTAQLGEDEGLAALSLAFGREHIR